MKFTRRFDYREDNNGITGWMLRGMPQFDAVLEGLGIAHDTLEHFDIAAGIENEFQAFGAMVWGRVIGEYFYNFAGNHSYHIDPESILASDLSRFLEDCTYTVPNAPARKSKPLDDEEAEQIIFNIARKTIRGCVSEDSEVDKHALCVAARNMRDWLRVGFRRAEKRWPDTKGWQFSDLFHRIETEINEEHVKHIEQGDTLTITVNTVTLEHSIRRSYAD